MITETSTKEVDFIVVEVGGTVGDLESEVFLQSIMHMKSLRKDVNAMVIHVSLLPTLQPMNEVKTKPTQHSVKQLHIKGILPDALILRHSKNLTKGAAEIRKIAFLTGIKSQNIIVSPTVNNIYTLPQVLHQQNIVQIIEDKFNLPNRKVNLTYLENFSKMFTAREKQEKIYHIAIVGKYVKLKEAYLSIHESLYIASVYEKKKIKMTFILSDKINAQNVEDILDKYHGIIIAPGFDYRGHQGKIEACRYARVKNIPLLGICFGMQMAIIEFLKNKCGMLTTSEEFKEISEINDYSIIVLSGREPDGRIGGTLRLGDYQCEISKNSQTYNLYKTNQVKERHRHRYEINNKYQEILIKNGMNVVGWNKKLNLMEIVEITKHKFYICCQFHPEYSSNIKTPHPLFTGFLKAL